MAPAPIARADSSLIVIGLAAVAFAAKRVGDALNPTQLRLGWLPTSPDDERLVMLFREHWAAPEVDNV